ncbi:DUF2478 domain-containing protein [Bradyrhizobium genosp. P]|uniref:DUF2478 domain-containing protein n=1 Tax=Bradyrhizobium genosp. P TaxID=83641 RepID=UPI003CFAE6E4
MDAIVASRCRRLAAIVYDEQAYPDDILMEVIVRCRKAGFPLAGIIQRRIGGSVHRCHMLFVNLATGEQTSIFVDRCPASRGCKLDEDAMLQVVAQLGQDLAKGPKLLVLNKFGKVEAESVGMRELIAQAIFDGIPAVIGVPKRNLSAWREFAGDLSIELHHSWEVDDWLSRTAGCPPSTGQR